MSSSDLPDNNGDDPSLHGPQSPPAPATGTLTTLNALALVLGLQIGSGIFSTPSLVTQHITSPAPAIIIWFTAGLIVWTGAASFIELGRALPRNGGLLEYLRCCYGDFAGAVFAWVWCLICKPCSMAVIAMIFAEHLLGIMGVSEVDRGGGQYWVEKCVAVGGIVLVTGLNCWGAHTGARVANGFLVLKLLALFSIAGVGIWLGVLGLGDGVGSRTGWVWFGRQEDDLPEEEGGVWTMVGNYVTATFAALFCYGGWETIGFVAGDMKNPFRDLPRVLNFAMVIVILGFMVMNIALYIVLPMALIRGRETVAVTFGFHVFGNTGGLIYSLMVAISCLGALNANVFATGRLVVAATRRDYFPKTFGDPCSPSKDEEADYYRHLLRGYPPRVISAVLWLAWITERLRWENQIPVYAMLFNAIIASFFVIIGTFSSLITFIGISEYIFFFFAVLGLFILRRRTLSGDAVPRTWTLNLIIFCLFSGFIVLRGIITDPLQGLAVLGCVSIAWLARRWWATRAGDPVRENILLRVEEMDS